MANNKRLSASSMGAFLQCPRRFFYSHELGWVPDTEAVALTFGRAWHSFLEFITTSRRDETQQEISYTDRVYQYTCNPEIRKGLESMSEENLAMFLAMTEAYAPSFYQIGIVKECEKPFSFRVPGTRWMVNGYIDALDFYGNPVEYKTTSSDITEGAFYWLRLKCNLQAITYALAVGSEKVTYSVIRKPNLRRKQVPLLDDNGLKIVIDVDGNRALNKNGTPRQTASDGSTLMTREESIEEYSARLRNEMLNFGYLAVKEVQITDDQKWSTIQSYISAAKQIDTLRNLQKKATRVDLPWARNCTEFNCRNCPYQGLCLDVDYNPIHGVPQGFQTKSKGAK